MYTKRHWKTLCWMESKNLTKSVWTSSPGCALKVMLMCQHGFIRTRTLGCKSGRAAMKGEETVTSWGQKGRDRKMRKRGVLSALVPWVSLRVLAVLVWGHLALPLQLLQSSATWDWPTPAGQHDDPPAMPTVHTLSASPGAAPRTC